MMAENSREKISRSDIQSFSPVWETIQCVVCSTSLACRLLWYGLPYLGTCQPTSMISSFPPHHSPGIANLQVSQQRRQCCGRYLELGDAAVAGQQVVAEVLQGAATGHPGVGEHVEIPPVNSLKQIHWSFKPVPVSHSNFKKIKKTNKLPPSPALPAPTSSWAVISSVMARPWLGDSPL